MDIKDFIKETIGGIVDAAIELQDTYEEQGVIINPPMSDASLGATTFEENSPYYILRRVQDVEFDVALTASTDTRGGGKAGLRIMSAEVGADGYHGRRHEEVSRVKFSIPITLRLSGAEEKNSEARAEQAKRLANAPPPSRSEGW